MTSQLRALVVHARTEPADERAAFASLAEERLPPGGVLVETCHRIEVYGAPLTEDLRRVAPKSALELRAEDAARHLVRLAVGRESAVLAEDQILHQLRTALARARARAPVPVDLDRLFDIALRTGRRARSWIPGRRGSLADVALSRLAGMTPQAPGRVLVVGAGDMARQAAHTLNGRASAMFVASRTPERAQLLAAEIGATHVSFDPGAALAAQLDGVVVALRGRWDIDQATTRALLESGAWVIDLSAPSALADDVVGRLGQRLVAIDDLAVDARPALSARMISRLDALVEEAVEEYCAWSAQRTQRAAASELAQKALTARSVELDALWERLPDLEPDHRHEVERMAHHLTERLLRDPLEQLHRDDDGRRAQAVRELFRL
jgi:glutamyl-tRNA reductase